MARAGRKPIGPIASNGTPHLWTRSVAMCSRLFKYTQQHIAGFIENSIGPVPHKTCPDREHDRTVVRFTSACANSCSWRQI